MTLRPWYPLVALVWLTACTGSISAPAAPSIPAPSPVSAPNRPEPRSPRLVVVSWDGAADWKVDELLAAGKLPNLAALAARGFAAEHSVTAFPSKTAAGHATLWAGCWPSVHGITANRIPILPRAEHTLLEHRSGFSSEGMTAEPLYVTAALAGRKVAVLAATQNYPAGRWVEELEAAGVDASRFVSVSGFEHEVDRGGMVGSAETTFDIAETTFRVLAYDDPSDPTLGFDRVRVRSESGEEAVLRPVEADAGRENAPHDLWSPPFAVAGGPHRAFTRFRLFRLAPDGSELALYHRSASGLDGHAPGSLLSDYRAAYPDFHDVAFYRYEDGTLGIALPDGGDGTAEARLLEIVLHDMETLEAGARWSLDDFDADVLFHYTPMIDAAGHTWLALLDPAGPRYDPDLAARIEPLYDAVYRAADRWLGKLMAAAGPDAVVAVVSDHGMTPTHRDFHPNRALADADLVAVTGSGRPDDVIDLSKTKILAPPFGFFFLNVNHTGWKDGIVPPEEVEAVLQEAEDVLRSVRDPATGRLIVNRTFRADEAPGLGIGGPAGGDLYFDLVPGYYTDAWVADEAVTDARTPWGRGGHGFWPERRDMHAIFYAGGPGLGEGETLPPVRHIDVAPTLAAAVDLPRPAGACGHNVVQGRSRSGTSPERVRE